MVILGLDPGVARTGFGLITTTPRPSLITCGCLTTAPQQPLADRLVELGSDLTKIIKQHRPDIAVVEQIYFGTNTTTAIQTAHTRGLYLYLLRRSHVTVEHLTPLQIKSQLTGYGRATKHQVQDIVTRRLGLKHPPQPDDAADALAAALCQFDNLSSLTKMAQYNKKT